MRRAAAASNGRTGDLRRAADGAGGLVGVRIAHVFDVSQTDGDPGAPPCRPRRRLRAAHRAGAGRTVGRAGPPGRRGRIRAVPAVPGWRCEWSHDVRPPPLADGPVVLGRRARRAPRLGRAAAVARHDPVRRRRRRAAGCSGPCSAGARRRRRRRRSPTPARPTCSRSRRGSRCILLPFAGAALAHRARRPRRAPAAGGATRPPSPWSSRRSGRSTPPASCSSGSGPVLWLAARSAVRRGVDPRRRRRHRPDRRPDRRVLASGGSPGSGPRAATASRSSRYTETAEVVASASNGAEVLRSLGYWFFYGGDRLGPWIEPSVSYTQRLPLLPSPTRCRSPPSPASARARFRHRSFFVALVVVGALVVRRRPSVGRRRRSSAPASRPFLALRRRPGHALAAAGRAARRPRPGRRPRRRRRGAGACAGAPAPARRRRRPCGVAVAVAAYAALPPLWTGGMVAENLDRPEDVPDYWEEPAAYLDARRRRHAGARAARAPTSPATGGATPSIPSRPASSTALRRPGAHPLRLAAVRRPPQRPRPARPGAHARPRRPRRRRPPPRRRRRRAARRPPVRALPHARGPTCSRPTSPTSPASAPRRRSARRRCNTPVAEAPLLDELALLADDGRARPPVEVLPVDDAVPIVRAKPASGGDRAGRRRRGPRRRRRRRAAATATSWSGTPRRSAPTASPAPSTTAPRSSSPTATGARAAAGRRCATPSASSSRSPTLGEDLTDNRLPVFDGPRRTVRDHHRGRDRRRRTATSYGNPISFTPEFRPANAVDGELAHRVAHRRRRPTCGASASRSTLRRRRPAALRFVQQLTGEPNRHITEVELRFDDGGPSQRVVARRPVADPRGPARRARRRRPNLRHARPSRSSPTRAGGCRASGGPSGSTACPRSASPRSTSARCPAPAGTERPGRSSSRRRPPRRSTTDTPLAVVLTRWRTEATEAVRRDPEPSLGAAASRCRSARDLRARPATPACPPTRPTRVLDTLAGVDRAPRHELEPPRRRRAPSAARRRSTAIPTTWWSPAFGDDEPALARRIRSAAHVRPPRPRRRRRRPAVAPEPGSASRSTARSRRRSTVPAGGGRIDLPARGDRPVGATS